MEFLRQNPGPAVLLLIFGLMGGLGTNQYFTQSGPPSVGQYEIVKLRSELTHLKQKVEAQEVRINSIKQDVQAINGRLIENGVILNLIAMKMNLRAPDALSGKKGK